MTTIPAENAEIVIRDGHWRIVPAERTLSAQFAFQVARGMGVMEYTSAFAEEHKLPGTILSVEYVRAVVIGYDERAHRWRLGLHLARSETDKFHWRELARWPTSDNAQYAAPAQQAARELAEHIGAPLRVFGAKKEPHSVQGGVTGPLTPHKREDIGPQRVKLMAQEITLPIQYPNMWLGENRNGLTLKIGKDLTSQKRSGEAPAFNQCIIDTDQTQIRLLPPTGLLTAFLSGQQARVLKTSDVRNVEFRYMISNRFVTERGKDNLMTETRFILHNWEVYLTLIDESLLLAQTHHETNNTLLRQRASSQTGDLQAGINYLRQHQEDQKAHDAAETFALNTAVAIASALNTALVKTQVQAPETS